MVEGPLRAAVWKIAWPTMVTNAFSGLVGMVDHVLVGHLIGYQANAAIGASWQILLVVITFISSLFTGMSVLVARFAGAGDSETVDRVVYQAFLTAVGLSVLIMAPVGYFASPWLLDLINAAPAVQAEALPYLRILFGFSSGMMLSFIGSLAQSAAAQAVFAVSYGELFSLITWTSVGLMGSAAAVAGQNFGAGHPDRADQSVHIAARYGVTVASFVGLFFLFFPRTLLAVFGMHDPVVVDIGTQLLRVLSVSGLFVSVALAYTRRLQGTGDTESPLYISMSSQIFVPLGICFVIQWTGTLDPNDICLAILAWHTMRRRAGACPGCPCRPWNGRPPSPSYWRCPRARPASARPTRD